MYAYRARRRTEGLVSYEGTVPCPPSPHNLTEAMESSPSGYTQEAYRRIPVASMATAPVIVAPMLYRDDRTMRKPSSRPVSSARVDLRAGTLWLRRRSSPRGLRVRMGSLGDWGMAGCGAWCGADWRGNSLSWPNSPPSASNLGATRDRCPPRIMARSSSPSCPLPVPIPRLGLEPSTCVIPYRRVGGHPTDRIPPFLIPNTDVQVSASLSEALT